MKTLKVTLKQHTPLIHFQHDQYGATLRASEVKPKLDKYIINHRFNKDFARYKPFLKVQPTDGENTPRDGKYALDYKMSIIPFEKKEVSLRINGPNEDHKYTTQDFPMLLSNMGGKDRKDELTNLLLHNHVILTILTSNDELYEILKEVIPVFFANTNFGQRSSKGFGSFTTFSINEDRIKWNPSLYYEEGCPLMIFKFSSSDEKEKQKLIFDVLDFYWKCLKAGINYKNGYIKSYLYYYLNNLISPARTWEKRSIKSTFGLGKPSPNISPNNNQAIFARALLGCPDKYLYGSNEVVVEHYTNNEEQKIVRIPTPIYFKPVCIGEYVYIYILFDSSIIRNLENVPDKTFRMSYRKRSLDIKVELFINAHNYMEFIEGYHEYLSFNEKVLKALYSKTDRKKYVDADSKNFEEDSYGFVPKNFHWNDILRDQQYVSFDNV